ncbi:MAG: GDSL-type esterase/lipase family protein [Bacteroidia bacterium]|nr:GDSL-type esterase/lipase family protein [Bacteroidia bacterium]
MAGVEKKYEFSFIREDINQIDNYSKGLKNFYEQLYLLEQGRRRTVNIVHIGDSHIQADWFSGMVRTRLQTQFGSAGRGLVFPYSVAKTNSPADIKSYSSTPWDARRNVNTYSTIPTGISGISLKTYTSNFLLKLEITNYPEKIDYRFNKITLFTDKGPRNYDIKVNSPADIPAYQAPLPALTAVNQTRIAAENDVYHEVKPGESLGIISAMYKVSIEDLRRLNNIEGNIIYAGQKIRVKQTQIFRSGTETFVQKNLGSEFQKDQGAPRGDYSGGTTHFASTVYLPQPVNTVYLRGEKNKETQQEATIYGMVLENYDQSGILYHMIGVNGARFDHYNQSEYFMDQLHALKPDLIIISLGTNETMGDGFNRNTFFNQMDEFIYLLEQHTPHADILITTPPDALRAGRYPNQNVPAARDVILGYALSNDLSCWNFFDVMGGTGSIQNWYSSGLAQKDRLHLTRTGYELQGVLLYEALMKGYGAYRANR